MNAVQQMPRRQLEATARRLGISNPQAYLMPDLRVAVRTRYARQKKEGGLGHDRNSTPSDRSSQA